MSKPVVVPTTMDKNLYKKVEPIKRFDLDETFDDEIEDDVQAIINEHPKRRGRPRKNPIIIEESIEESKPKRRGRPRKEPLIEEQAEDTDTIYNLAQDDYDIDEKEDANVLPGLEDDDFEDNQSEDNILPGFDNDKQSYNEESIEDNVADADSNDLDNNNSNVTNNYYNDEEYDEVDDYNQSLYSEEKNNMNDQDDNRFMNSYDNSFDDDEYQGLLTSEKKVVSFVGTSKNGTSFLVNNLAVILSNIGINTAILDATANKNDFYIYTKNDDDLRRIATNTFDNLINENAEGIKVNRNLTVYTTIPSKRDQINSARPILQTLIRNHSLVLIDCDFNTPIEYFSKSQELYLVQSMDVLTIQPLTEFLRELKVKNVLDEKKIRIVLNKLLKVKGVNPKNLIGGMSNYNDPEMSFMTELFNRNTVKISSEIPFDEDVYIKYLNSLVECDIQVSGYPKEFKQKLNFLAESVYPLLPGKRNSRNERSFPNSFSPGMNSTLDNMRKKY